MDAAEVCMAAVMLMISTLKSLQLFIGIRRLSLRCSGAEVMAQTFDADIFLCHKFSAVVHKDLR